MNNGVAISNPTPSPQVAPIKTGVAENATEAPKIIPREINVNKLNMAELIKAMR